MKCISWNVNGLRACLKKGFMESFVKLDADVFALQETKMQPGQADVDLPGYVQYWNSAEKKGYSGTAVFSRMQPLAVTYGMGIEAHDHEGRLITLEFADFYFVAPRVCGIHVDIKNPKFALFLTALATNLPLANAYRHIAPKSNANAAPVPKHLFLASHPALA